MGHGEAAFEGAPADLRQREEIRNEWLAVGGAFSAA